MGNLYQRAESTDSSGDGRRTASIYMRVSPAEKAWLRTHADEEGLSLTAYVISKTVRGEALSGLASAAVLKDIHRELNAQGNNLNQLARSLNRMARATEDGASEHDIAEFVAGIWRETEETLPALNVALRGCSEVLGACGIKG